MTSAQRIALNTIVTYLRSVLTIGITLFSSRWILASLGQTDFGLYSIVGSLIVFLSFFNTILSGSTARHFAFCLGQNDIDAVNKWFNTALNIHIVLPVILIIVGWPIGEYCIRHVLKVPAIRMDTSVLVFRISLIPAFFSMAAVPFTAMFQAKQRLAELAIWELMRSLLIFTLAWLLRHLSGDLLLMYTCGMGTIAIILYTTESIRAYIIFPDCKFTPNYFFNIKRTTELFSFAAWTIIGRLGGTLRLQGSGILLNLFFGPSVNSAYNIANQVSAQSSSLSASMMGAITPEITASEGRGNRNRMLDLSQSISKIGTLLVLLFAIPLIIEIDYVLITWLGKPPPYTATLCQLMLVTFTIDRLSAGYMSAINAYGKIAAYQVTIGGILLLTLPLAWLFLKLGFSPGSVGVAFVINQTICSIGRLFWARKIFAIRFNSWITSVVVPCAFVSTTMVLVTLVPFKLMQSSIFRFSVVCTVSFITSLIAIWYIGLESKERIFIQKSIWDIINKVKTSI